MASLEQLKNFIADALYPISAYQLQAAIEDLGLTHPNLEPFNNKKVYVKAALRGYSQPDLLEACSKVLEYHDCSISPDAKGAEDAERALEGIKAELSATRPASRNNLVKNIMFAGTSKPELGHRDLLSGEVESINDGGCLVYDRPLTVSGLTWKDLLDWYGDRIGHPTSVDDKAHALLKARLLLVITSHAEIPLFNAYWDLTVGEGNLGAPAMLPQIWVLLDPKTAQQRSGASYYAHQRMDFLMLLPQNERVVLEVDGKQHYADGDLASPTKYAVMVEADRDMSLRGYDVYRFGGTETNSHAKAAALAQVFFPRLFSKYYQE